MSALNINRITDCNFIEFIGLLHDRGQTIYFRCLGTVVSDRIKGIKFLKTNHVTMNINIICMTTILASIILSLMHC